MDIHRQVEKRKTLVMKTLRRVEDIIGELELTIDKLVDELESYDRDNMDAYYVDEHGHELSKEIATRRGLLLIKNSIHGLKGTLVDYDHGRHMRALTVGSTGTDATRPFNI